MGKTAIAVKPEEARNVMYLIELAFQSNREKRSIKVT
jgi:predicted dehydrogenase